MRELDEGRVAAMTQQLVMAFATSGLDAVIDAVVEGAAEMFERDPVPMQARYEMLLAGSRDEPIGELMRGCTRLFWELAKPVVIAAGSADPDGDARIVMAMVDGLCFDALTKGESTPRCCGGGSVRRCGRSCCRRPAGPRPSPRRRGGTTRSRARRP
jgi:hypothetical protein